MNLLIHEPSGILNLDPSSRLTTTDMGRKLGGGLGCDPFWEELRLIKHNAAWAEAYLQIPSGNYLIHLIVWPQYQRPTQINLLANCANKKNNERQ